MTTTAPHPSRPLALSLALTAAIALGGTACGPSDDPAATADSRELSTGAVDSDSDGLDDDVEAELGTSPFMADTDGDGFSDAQEILELGFDPLASPVRFNPRVADVPRLEVSVVSEPDVFLNYTTSDSSSRSFDNTTSNTASEGFTTSTSSSESVRTEVSNTVGGEVSYGTMWGVSANYSHSWSEARETSFSWTEGRSFENSRTLSQSRGFSESKDITNSGCRVEVAVDLRNVGNLSFTLQTLSLGMRKLNPRSGDVLEIGQLEPESDRTFHNVTSLAPGEPVRGLVFRAELPLAKAEVLLGPGRMSVRPTMFELVDGEGTPFDQRYTRINAATSTITIDRGDRAPVSYEVATFAPRGAGLPLDVALEDVLRIPFETGTALWKGRDGLVDTQPCLLELDGLATDSGVGGYWVVEVHDQGRTESIRSFHPLEDALDLASIALRPTVSVRFVYVQDVDRDGLGARTEAALGIDDRAFDTDGDGRGDGDEIKSGTNPRLGLATANLHAVRGQARTVTVAVSVRPGEYGELDGVSIDWGDDSGPSVHALEEERIAEVSHTYPDYGEYALRVSPVERERHGEPVDAETRASVREDERIVRVESPLTQVWSRVMDESVRPPKELAATANALLLGSEVRDGRTVTYSVASVSPEGDLRWVTELSSRGRAEMEWWDGEYAIFAADAQGRSYMTDHDRIFALSPQGEPLWERSGKVFSLTAAPDGTVFFAGLRSDDREILGRIDDGDVTWEKLPGLPKSHRVQGLSVGEHRELLHSYGRRDPAFGMTDRIHGFQTMDGDGRITSSGFEIAAFHARFQVAAPGGGVAVAGHNGDYFSSAHNGPYRAGIWRYSAKGELLWSEVGESSGDRSLTVSLARIPGQQRLVTLVHSFSASGRIMGGRLDLVVYDDATGQREVTKTLLHGEGTQSGRVTAGRDGTIFVAHPCQGAVRVAAYELNHESTRFVTGH